MAKRKEFSTLQMGLTLVLVCLGAALALATVNQLTREPIQKAQRQAKLQAISEVLPEFANEPDQDVVEVEVGGEMMQVYPAKDENSKLLGLAIPVSAAGYGGPGSVRLMVGVEPNGTIRDIAVLELKETPGLGDGITKDSFLNQMIGEDADTITWAVSKDKGDIDGVTAATISSRAAIGAVESAFPALEAYWTGNAEGNSGATMKNKKEAR